MDASPLTPDAYDLSLLCTEFVPSLFCSNKSIVLFVYSNTLLVPLSNYISKFHVSVAGSLIPAINFLACFTLPGNRGTSVPNSHLVAQCY